MGHRFIVILLLVIAHIACEDPVDVITLDQTPAADMAMGGEAQADADVTPRMEAELDMEMAMPTEAILPRDGAYFAGIELAELGGFVLPLQLVLSSESTPSGAIIRRFDVHALSGAQVSDVIAQVIDIPVGPDGTFQAVLPETTLPAAFSPTGSAVVFEVTFQGTIQSERFFCGRVVGTLTTLSTPIRESTFGAIPWAERGAAPPTQCTAMGDGEACPRLEEADCPTLMVGQSNRIRSCDRQREFILHVPADHDPSVPKPIVFLWHGLGSDAESMIDITDFPSYVDRKQFVLVTPSSQGLPVEWDQLATGDNPDLAFFDDMLTCAHAQLGVDLDRVHVTGMSAGGLWSTYLSVFRADIIASSAPMSGGLIADYVEPARKMPMLVSWGGENDVAVDQNFHVFAQNLMVDLTRGGHFFVACNHGLEHVWERDFTPWVLRFLLDHPRTLESEPYADGLPGSFPDYCVLPD